MALPFDEPKSNASPADDRMLAMLDMQQELLARSMGEGHRIVRGVAGSGKTLILAFRAEQIARAASRPVLLLSYRIILVAGAADGQSSGEDAEGASNGQNRARARANER
jgi:excinuclease UvrABC helicase subunit UvrB